MPLYRCTVALRITSPEQRALIGKEIARIHCEITGAPAKFVHAFFAEDTEGKLPEDKQAVVLGGIRAGRTPEQKQQLTSELRKSVASILGRSEEEVLVATTDVPARWIMEGGRILPEPGEEEAWFAEHG